MAQCAPDPRAMYSASVLDSVVMSCLQLVQLIGEFPDMTRVPHTALSSSSSSPASVQISRLFIQEFSSGNDYSRSARQKTPAAPAEPQSSQGTTSCGVAGYT